MSHFEALNLDVDKIMESRPIQPSQSVSRIMWFAVAVGTFAFLRALFFGDPAIAWAAYFTNLTFWMGITTGSLMLPVIFQIVRAQWSPPVRRIAEANVAFLPWAYFLLLGSYFGSEYLFPWGRAPMPGREWWMQPEFVYLRFGLLFFLLFFLFWRFVRLSLRTDIGMIRERAKSGSSWVGWVYDYLTKGWNGSAKEILRVQPILSWNAPLLVVCYAIIVSLFAFEMIMGMDKIWYSNMFGGFIFIGNIYLGWAVTTMWVTYFTATNKDYAAVVTSQQFWDLGKLTFGFTVLWAYLFFSQFLPQWYGNLPEETQWMILRTREYPWKAIGWSVLSMCFVIPFITLLSRDVKKTPPALATVCLVIALGMWLERYLIIMPQFTPDFIPFSGTEVGIFFGFLGAYVLSITSFLSRFPYISVSHPLTHGSTEW